MTPSPAPSSLPPGPRTMLLLVTVGAVLLSGLVFQPSPDAMAPVRPVAPPDTMTVEVNAGQPLITDLPSRYGGRPIRAYRIARAPALASVAGESLLWITRPGDVGQHDIALLAQTVDAPADTVWVRVNVTAAQ